jgi:hypothetical protein
VAVQQLGKKQAKKEKKNQKALDDEFARDEEKALEDTQRMIDLMEKIYKDEKVKERTSPIREKPPKIRNPGGPILEAKDGGSVEGKRLTRTVPPKKGPNSQGMRGTGIAISGTKFKGVF